MAASPSTFWGGWRERIRALRNVPPLLLIVWRSGPSVVAGGLGCRILARLYRSRCCGFQSRSWTLFKPISAASPLPEHFWWLVAAEFLLAAIGAILGRAAGFFDALLADRFTRHVSVRVIEHASRLDLASYEDPVFYDKLERARVQATDRIAMIQAIGALLQQFIIAVSLSASIFWFSPVAAAAFDRRGGSGVSWGKPFRFSRVFA